MPDRAQDTEAIRAALNRSSGPRVLEADAALGRLVARLEAAEQERDKANEDANILTGDVCSIDERATRAEKALDGLADAVTRRRCNGCGLPDTEWGPMCVGMPSGDATHYHSAAWWAAAARAALAAAAPGETTEPG